MDKLKLYRVYFKFNKPAKYVQNNFMTWQFYQGTMKWAGDRHMWEVEAMDVGASSPTDTEKYSLYPTVEDVERHYSIGEVLQDLKSHELHSREYIGKILRNRWAKKVHKFKREQKKIRKAVYLYGNEDKIATRLGNPWTLIFDTNNMPTKLSKNNVVSILKEWNKLNTSSQEEL